MLISKMVSSFHTQTSDQLVMPIVVPPPSIMLLNETFSKQKLKKKKKKKPGYRMGFFRGGRVTLLFFISLIKSECQKFTLKLHINCCEILATASSFQISYDRKSFSNGKE